MKKKLTALLLVCLVCCAAALPAFAQGTTHRLADGLLTVTIPEEADVMSREIAEDDPVWEEYGITKDMWIEEYDEDNRPLAALWPERQLELWVMLSVMPDLYGEEYEFDSEKADSLKEVIMTYGIEGITMENGKVITANDRYFVEAEAFSQELDCDTRIYVTCVDENMWLFAFYDYGYDFDGEDHALIQQILESVRFEKGAAAPVEPVSRVENADPVVFTDPLVGTQITLPPHWEVLGEPEYDEEDGSMLVVFADPDLYDPLVIYASADLYETGNQYGRKDSDSELFSLEELGEMADSGGAELAQKYFGDKLYLYFESVDEETGDELTIFYRLEDAVEHLFIVDGKVDDPAFAPVEEMIAGMVYPEFPAEEMEDSDGPVERVLTKALGGVLAGGVLGLAGLAYALVSKKRNKADPEPAPAQPDPQQQPGASQVRFCSHCGAPLVENSRFCAACGTEVYAPGGEEE